MPDEETVIGGGFDDFDDEVEVIELDEEATELDKARAAVGASEYDDPLAVLLAVDTSQPITERFPVKRLKTEFTIQGISDDEAYEKLVERATSFVRRRGGARQREVDGRKLSRLLVIAGVVSPPFSPENGRDGFEALKKKYGALDSEDLVAKALLPGEVDRIAEKVLELSGFEDELEEAAGN